MLPIFPVVAFAIAYLVGRVAIRTENLIRFLQRIDNVYPWELQAIGDNAAATVAYACGFGTLGLLAAAVVAGVIRSGQRAGFVRIAVAWVIGAIPLWFFWVAHPPMSNRHAVPGALLTVLLAVLAASRLLPRIRYAALVWLVALVGINWPFGTPSMDFNYFPSGNLAATLSLNRRAFAVCEEIARQVADGPEQVKILLGKPQVDVLGGIDFEPAVEVEMAERSRAVHAVQAYVLVYSDELGRTTTLHGYMHPVHARPYVRLAQVRYYSMWPVDLRPLHGTGVDIVSIDPDDLFDRMSER
jgi:hypothetical protein